MTTIITPMRLFEYVFAAGIALVIIFAVGMFVYYFFKGLNE